jgi:hypothetical protein
VLKDSSGRQAILGRKVFWERAARKVMLEIAVHKAL